LVDRFRRGSFRASAQDARHLIRCDAASVAQTSPDQGNPFFPTRPGQHIDARSLGKSPPVRLLWSSVLFVCGVRITNKRQCT